MKQPNFLVFVTDQHRADYLGCYGHPVLRTPNIDRIAAAGTRFERCYVASPVCMPNRASLLTGRYPSVHGLRSNGHALSLQARTFVDVLRAGGWRTAHIGKSHVQPMTDTPAGARVSSTALGLLEEAWRDDGDDCTQEQPHHYQGTAPYAVKTPFYGYDEVDLVTRHGDQCHGHYLQWLRRQAPDAEALRERSRQLPHDYVCPQAFRTPIPEDLYPTAYIRDRAVDFLTGAAREDRPFFAFVSFPDPHHPFTPPGRYWDLYRPSDFEVPLPFEAHRNPPPPLRWSRERMLDGSRERQGQTDSFMATEHEIREAMALTCGMIAMIDDAVGDILRALEASGRYEDTVIVFTSDHGDYLGDYGMMLKGALAMRSILRVPFIWSDPAHRVPQVDRSLASTIDLAPTVLARAGLQPYFGMQGHDLMSDPRRQERDALLVEFQDIKARQGFRSPAAVRTLVTPRYRYSTYLGESWGELYDHENDPDESHNRWADPGYARVRANLAEQLVQQMIGAAEQSPRARFQA